MSLDLLTPKEALQAVVVGAIVSGYSAGSKWIARKRAVKKEFALKSELVEFGDALKLSIKDLRADMTGRMDEFASRLTTLFNLRTLERDKIMEQAVIPPGTYKVLLVEDNRDDRHLFHRLTPCLDTDD